MESSENAEVVLASASPRRRELLTLAGVPHRVIQSGVDERLLPGEGPEDFTQRAAAEKAEAVAQRSAAGTWVLAADTAVVVDEEILGKPLDADDARRMLARLSGRRHRVLTAVNLCRAGEGQTGALLEQTWVLFRPLSTALIEGYLATGEPMDKAGAYGIQGRGAVFVRAIEGSYTNVVGLPLCETVELLERAGVFAPYTGGAP